MKQHENKLFIIIQARMTSIRLPGKVMLPLCEKTVLEVMFERISNYKNQIIIATTNDDTEKPIIALCERLGINVYRGDTNNVLSRYYEAAIHYGAKKDDIIVRLTSDCPLHDQEVVHKVIEAFKKSKCDFMSNAIHRKFPRGLDVAVFRFKLLKEAFNNATTDYEKEHVTAYFYSHSNGKIKIESYEDIDDNSKYRLTLDEEDDYNVIKEVYKRFNCKTDFMYDELIAMLNKNSYIHEMNAHVEQKKH
jgi:spore coat polysaccharide biosynthesis protein SpsF